MDNWIRVYEDTSEESKEAIRLLREAGYLVISIHVEGTVGPELEVGRTTYYGLNEIKEFITKNKNNK